MAKISCIEEEITIFQKQSFPKYQNIVHPLWQFCIYTESSAENSLEIFPFSVLVTLCRETTEKALGVTQWLQSWPIRKHDVSWFPTQLCITGVSTQAPGTQPDEPQKYYHSVTTPSKHVYEKLLILICHPIIWQDPEEWMPAMNSLLGGVHITSSNFCHRCPNWPLQISLLLSHFFFLYVSSS